MSSPTTDPKSGSQDPHFAFPWTTESLYDALMYMIEPELMTAMIPILPALYEGETDQEKKERTQRYQKAFEEYEKKMMALFTEWKTDIKKLGKDFLKELKAHTKKNEDQILDDISSSIDAS